MDIEYGSIERYWKFGEKALYSSLKRIKGWRKDYKEIEKQVTSENKWKDSVEKEENREKKYFSAIHSHTTLFLHFKKRACNK